MLCNFVDAYYGMTICMMIKGNFTTIYMREYITNGPPRYVKNLVSINPRLC